MSNIRVVPSDGEPCESCGDSGDVRLLVIEVAEWNPDHRNFYIALCPQCRIKTEAVLRGARKGGPRVGQWGGK